MPARYAYLLKTDIDVELACLLEPFGVAHQGGYYLLTRFYDSWEGMDVECVRYFNIRPVKIPHWIFRFHLNSPEILWSVYDQSVKDCYK